MDLFTPEFKRLKARRPPPDFSHVIDINNLEHKKSVHKIEKIQLNKTDAKPVTGFRPCEKWNVYRFPEFPGFIIIQNPFLDGYQPYWISRCLKDFSSDKRNSSNLTNLGQFEYYNVWEDFVSRQCSTFEKDDPLRKLRWVTLGYHYGWDVKEYSEDRKAEFPADVQCLSQYFSHCLGFGPFRAEAGIVNYYHLDSTLGGHTDHSEIDHTAPLLSFSFGQTCVFLLGGPTKETKPMAIYLHGGDVCVMSKEARLAYHAVPKILSPKDNGCLPPCPSVDNNNRHTNNGGLEDPEQRSDEETQTSHSMSSIRETNTNVNSDAVNTLDTCSSHTDKKDLNGCITNINGCIDMKSTYIPDEYSSNIDALNENIEKVVTELDWRPFETFLKESRINLNLRQVLPPGYKAVEPQMEKSTYEVEY